jgi:predicted CopG family antitoxin
MLTMVAKEYKRIVVSEDNYHKMQKMGYAGDSFNDVISMLIEAYEARKKNK